MGTLEGNTAINNAKHNFGSPRNNRRLGLKAKAMVTFFRQKQAYSALKQISTGSKELGAQCGRYRLCYEPDME